MRRIKLSSKKKQNFIVLISVSAFLTFYYFSIPTPLFSDPVCIVLEDKNHTLIGAHISKDEQWRFPETSEVPEKFKHAIIAYEDRRFLYHQGFDPVSILRAIYTNLKAGKKVSGGSTLTMQVIRLARKGQARTYPEKLIEIFLAVRLECTASKNEILSLYASHAPFGGNIVGIDAASWFYFGRNADKLSWAESAMLAVLPNSPSLVHPGKNRNSLKIKRDRLLKKLYMKNLIDKETYELSTEEPIPLKQNDIPRVAPHLLDRIYNEQVGDVAGALCRYQATLDVNLQKNVKHILDNHHANALSGNGIYNAAALVINNETNEVMAYVGNTGDLKDSRHGANVDIINSPRSTGSILKPFLYAAMLSGGEILPNALVPDIPTRISGYTPKNFNMGYDGAVPAKRAIARSLNIPAIRMLQDYGIAKFLYKLRKLGMSTVTKNADYYGLSLILGGCEGTLWEMCGVYASMARSLNHFSGYSGRYDPDDYKAPEYIFRVKKKRDIFFGKLEKNYLLSASSIWLTFQTMIDVERPPGEANWQYFSSARKIAWKTGTSFGFRDGWAIGVTPGFTIGVWVGNADGEGRPELTGINCAAPVLFDILNLLPRSNKWFDQPYDDMVYTGTCRLSGFLPSDECEDIDPAWIPKAGLLFRKCPYHKLIHLDKSEKWRVHGNCEEPSGMVHKPWFVLPPVMEWYYKYKNFNYKPLPGYRPDCLANLTSSPTKTMEIIYPKDFTKIYVPVELNGKIGGTVFEVAHRNPDIMIFWYVDNKFSGTTSRFHHMALQPTPGKHLLTLVDENGDKIEQYFEIISKVNN